MADLSGIDRDAIQRAADFLVRLIETDNDFQGPNGDEAKQIVNDLYDVLIPERRDARALMQQERERG